jgi:hypothetical protein
VQKLERDGEQYQTVRWLYQIALPWLEKIRSFCTKKDLLVDRKRSFEKFLCLFELIQLGRNDTKRMVGVKVFRLSRRYL